MPRLQIKKNFTVLSQPILIVFLLVAAFYTGRLFVQKYEGKINAPEAITPPNSEVLQQGPLGTKKLDVANLKERAKKIGLDTVTFNQCLDNATMAERVSKDVKEAESLGVHVTPSFFINGILLEGIQTQAIFESIIDAELKNKTGDKVALEVVLGVISPRQKLDLSDSYTRGTKDAPIHIIEFTDFECPFCEEAVPMIRALEEKYQGKMILEYKSLPLTAFHKSAQKAAEAALCAGEQGKFWEMYDNLLTEAI